jgi:hypothetical protein
MIFYGDLHPGVDNGRRALVVFLGFGVGETELELGRSMMPRTFGPLLSDPGKPNRGKPCEGGTTLSGSALPLASRLRFHHRAHDGHRTRPATVMDRKCICYTADLFRQGRPLILRYRFFADLQANSIPKPDNKSVGPNSSA